VNDPERDVNVAAGINQRRAQRPNQALYTSDLVSCTAISETRGPLREISDVSPNWPSCANAWFPKNGTIGNFPAPSLAVGEFTENPTCRQFTRKVMTQTVEDASRTDAEHAPCVMNCSLDTGC